MAPTLLLQGHDTIECAYYLAPGPDCALDYERLGVEKEALRTAKVRRPKAIQLGSEEFLLLPNGTKSGYPFLIENEWYAALARAGIEDFRWHDLRHTWASWHVQGGTPLYALQEMGGWESPEMVRRYAHLTADHLAEYAERLCAQGDGESLGTPHVTNVAQ